MGSIKERLYEQSVQQRIPLTGAFEVSPVCNFNCSMCYVRQTPHQVREQGGLLPPEFWLDIIGQAKEVGTLYPLITGGEPFVYPHLRQLYEAMYQAGMQVSINSNGSCISEETAGWLKESVPQRINVTLYGGSNESYERLCGDPRGFDKVAAGVRYLADNGIRFQFNCSLTPYNKGDILKMLEFARQYGQGLRVATYMFPPVRRTGQAGDYGDRLTPEEAAYYQVLVDSEQLQQDKFLVLAENAQKYRDLTPELLAEAEAKEPGKMRCLAGRSNYWVDWKGNLSGCGMMTIPQVSLKEYTLKQAWEQVVAWTDDFFYSPVCANCVNRTVCHCCPAMVRNETGNFRERPVYLCELRKHAARYYREFAEKIREKEG